ncbi:radical SAM protein [bacterium]|nr:radical SAM protein [bacterium]
MKSWNTFGERIARAVPDGALAGYCARIARLIRLDHPAARALRVFWHHPKAWRYNVQMVRAFILNEMARGHFQRAAFRTRTGVEAPLAVMISPTNRCNLQCKGCYASAGTGGGELSFDEVDGVVRQAKAMGVHFFVISGGEPFMWPGLLDLLEKHRDAIFLIYTNGTCITASVAKRLARIANNGPALSLEGGREQTDARRGAGVFDRIEEAFARLREARALYGFSATVSSANFNAIAADAFRRQQIDRGCAFGWLFHYVPVGRDAQTDWMLTPAQRIELFHLAQRWRTQDAIAIIDFWNDGPLVGGCIAGGRRYLHVNANGDVEPCAFVRFATHNIRTSSLEDALLSPFFSGMRAQQKAHENLLVPCFLIDHTAELAGLVNDTGAHSTDGWSAGVLCRCGDDLAARAEKYRAVAEPVWRALPPEALGAYKHWVPEI